MTALLGLLSPTSPSTAQVPVQERPRASAGPRQSVSWTVDDVIRGEDAEQFRISPDGRWAVWVRRAPNPVRNRAVGNLVLSSLTESREVPLTRGPDSCTEPKWSPDGRRIAFLSARPLPQTKEDAAPQEKDQSVDQLWLLDPFGGEPWPLTRGPRAVTAYEWAGPETIVFVSSQEPDGKRDKEDTTLVIDDEAHEPPARLFGLDVKTQAVTRLTDNHDRIKSLAVSPDGRWVVTTHERSLRFEYDNEIKPVSFLYDLKTLTRRPIFQEPRFNLALVQWTADGRGFYAANLFTTSGRYVMATVTEMYHYDLAAGTATKVDLGWPKGLSSQWESEDLPAFHVSPDGFVALLADGVRNVPARYVREGSGWRRLELTGVDVRHMFGFTLSRDGRTLVYTHSTAQTPTQWYRARLDGACVRDPVPITHLNEYLKGKSLARTEMVRWKGALGQEVEGLLYYPHHYQSGMRYPLVVLIHGGPMLAELDAWAETWSHPQNLLNARGTFVFKPNYHGSSNYGLDWVESLQGGKYLDLELTDIEKGVDALIARGLADPRRLALMGRSNGAILAAALTTQTGRYQAASCMAGTVDQAGDWGYTTAGAAFDQYYLGKAPWEDPQLYVRKSSFYQMDKVQTPTLISIGAKDRVVGTPQAWMHYRALQQVGKAPVRLLVFPEEGHDLEQLTHQRRKLQEELAWFDRYLFRKADR